MWWLLCKIRVEKLCVHCTFLTTWVQFHSAAFKAEKKLLNNFRLSRNEQDTSQKLYTWHGSLGGNLILVSIIFWEVATFCALSSSMKLSPGSNFIERLLKHNKFMQTLQSLLHNYKTQQKLNTTKTQHNKNTTKQFKSNDIKNVITQLIYFNKPSL